MDMDADIDVMLADSGEPMTFDAFTGNVNLDIADQEMVPTITGVLGEVRVGVIRTSAFPGLAVGSAVTVSGVAYKIADRKRVGDGRLTLIALGAA